MNNRLLSIDTSRALTVSRAQLSPLARRFTARSQRRTVARFATPAIAAPLPAIASALPRESASFSQRLWSPRLLDRLQAPLTRHRE